MLHKLQIREESSSWLNRKLLAQDRPLRAPTNAHPPTASEPSASSRELPRTNTSHRLSVSSTSLSNQTPRVDTPTRTASARSSLSLKSPVRSLPDTLGRASKTVSFNPKLEYFEADAGDVYERQDGEAVAKMLTPKLALEIRQELNLFKMVCISIGGFVLVGAFADASRQWRYIRSLSSMCICSETDAGERI